MQREMGAISMNSEINKSCLNKPSDIQVLSLKSSLSDVVSPEFDESSKQHDTKNMPVSDANKPKQVFVSKSSLHFKKNSQ